MKDQYEDNPWDRPKSPVGSTDFSRMVWDPGYGMWTNFNKSRASAGSGPGAGGGGFMLPSTHPASGLTPAMAPSVSGTPGLAASTYLPSHAIATGMPAMAPSVGGIGGAAGNTGLLSQIWKYGRLGLLGYGAISALKGLGGGGDGIGGMKGIEQRMLAPAAANMGLGRELTRMGQSQYALGQPAYGKALSYYETLLGGNRSAMNQALAAPTAQITDTFRGAARNLDRQGVRGGEKTMAMAELNRDRANQIGQLQAGVQPMAAQALGQLGLQGTGQGFGGLASASGAYTGAGSIYASMLDAEAQKAAANRQAWGNIGGGIARAFLPWILKKWF